MSLASALILDSLLTWFSLCSCWCGNSCRAIGNTELVDSLPAGETRCYPTRSWDCVSPWGVAYIFDAAPFDIFFQLVPILDLTPDTEFTIEGAFGTRFWF